MNQDQVLEAAKLVNTRKLLVTKLADVDGRLKKLGVEIADPLKAAAMALQKPKDGK